MRNELKYGGENVSTLTYFSDIGDGMLKILTMLLGEFDFMDTIVRDVNVREIKSEVRYNIFLNILKYFFKF